MKILQVTLGFIPAYALGGPVKIVHQNSLELNRRDNQVTVCASNLLDKHTKIEPGNFERCEAGLRAVYLNMHSLRHWPGTTGPTWLGSAAMRWLWREIADADVIHVHGTRNMVSLAAAYFALQQRKPLVLQPHGSLQYIVASMRLKKLFDVLLLRRIVRHANALIASTPTEITQIAQAGGDQARIFTVPNGSNPKLFDQDALRGQFRAAYNIAPEQRLVLFLARINRKKGTDLLIDAWSRLDPDLRQEATLVIAGADDGQLAEVLAMVSEYGLEDEVLFTGLLSGDDVQAALIDADIFVLPCRTDTFPMALVEACEAGTPIVVTEACEIASLLDGKAATSVPVDPQAIADAIAELLCHPELGDQYRSGARELMRTTLSVEAVADKLETVYRSVLDERATIV